MGRHVNRKFILFLIRGYNRERKNHHYSCCCLNCKRFKNISQEIKQWSFYDSNNTHDKWFVIIHKYKITNFPVFI